MLDAMDRKSTPGSTTTNASTIRTRKRIHEAFLTLAESVDFADINVKMLTNKAGLNRTTFYLHYQSVAELGDRIVTELLEELNAGGKQLAEGMSPEDPDWHETFYRFIGERPTLFHRLLARPSASPFAERLSELNKRNVVSIWRANGVDFIESDPIWRMRVRFCTGGLYEITLQWLEEGMPVEAEEICAHSLEFLLHMAEKPVLTS